MNNQKPEPLLTHDGTQLDVHSIFFTIQGEGPFAGYRSVFVRLAGCNLQCPGCDTEYTQGRKLRSIEWIENTIAEKLYEYDVVRGNGILVVISGGEPLRQPIGRLVKYLIEFGYRVQIESNGMFAPDPVLKECLINKRGPVRGVTLVVSPKTQRINKETAELAGCFKYVLDHRSVATDGLPIQALEHPAAKGVARPWEYGMLKRIYLNPFDAGNEEDNKRNQDAVAKSCMEHGYILGLQLHKLLNLA